MAVLWSFYELFCRTDLVYKRGVLEKIPAFVVLLGAIFIFFCNNFRPMLRANLH